jgi:uncharacterized membrane protein
MAQVDVPASPTDHADPKAHIIHRLRKKHRDPTAAHKHPVNKKHFEDATRGERIADKVSAAIGSWYFIIIQSILLLFWVYINSVEFFTHKWDLYPFILLNLVLSFQATYAGPIVLLAGNRHAQKDRITLEHAADEADMGEEHINRILIEIKKNTELTLQILKELEAESA